MLGHLRCGRKRGAESGLQGPYRLVEIRLHCGECCRRKELRGDRPRKGSLVNEGASEALADINTQASIYIPAVGKVTILMLLRNL